MPPASTSVLFCLVCAGYARRAQIPITLTNASQSVGRPRSLKAGGIADDSHSLAEVNRSNGRLDAKDKFDPARLFNTRSIRRPTRAIAFKPPRPVPTANPEGEPRNVRIKSKVYMSDAIGDATGLKVPKSLIDSFQLLDGQTIPPVGLGVFRVQPGRETYRSVLWALEAGYRMIDTAQMYQNEKDVGRAIRDSGVPRQEIYVQSKLDTPNHGYDAALKTIQESLRKSGLQYFDCFLIHSPFGGKLVETWDALLAMKRSGKLRSVGVSNFGIRHLEALTELGRPTPVVNQFEMHPLVYRDRLDLIDYCQARGILVQAYGPLFGGYRLALGDKRLAEVVHAHPDKSTAHILLRWALQKGFQVIPKSVDRERIRDNLQLFDFELSASEEQAMSEWDPAGISQYWDPIADAGVDLGDIHSYQMKADPDVELHGHQAVNI